MSDYNNMEKRKHFFHNICIRKLKMIKMIHYNNITKKEYLFLYENSIGSNPETIEKI
jgi:hypothetical protein